MTPYRDSGLSREADQALDVITRLVGGERYCLIVGRNVNWIEVEARCSSDDGWPQEITIGVDGRVMHT